MYCFQLSYRQPHVSHSEGLPNPRSRVNVLTAVSGGGDGQHDAPEAAAAEEEEEAAAGKVVVAAAGAGETAAVAVVAAADGCVGVVSIFTGINSDGGPQFKCA